MRIAENGSQQIAKASKGLRSWYGRINIVTIVLCVIIGFAGMISISVLPNNLVPYQPGTTGIWYRSQTNENKTGIAFPSFQVDFLGVWPSHTPDSYSTFKNITCKYWGNDVHNIPLSADYSCSKHPTVRNCATIHTSPAAKAIAYDDDHILCQFWVHWNERQYLHWWTTAAFRPMHSAGPYDSGSVWIPPTNDSRVMLRKKTWKFTTDTKPDVWWGYDLEVRNAYTDTQAVTPPAMKLYLFNVAVVMRDLYVDNWVEQDQPPTAEHHFRNGFSNAGEIGGFWVFLAVIQTMFMWVVGLVIGYPNDEKDGYITIE